MLLTVFVIVASQVLYFTDRFPLSLVIMSSYPTLNLHVIRSCAVSPPQYFTSSQRPAQYKTYNEDRLRRAYTAVMEDKVSIRRAAVEYNVPRSTLGDRVRGRMLSGAVSGRQSYLSRGEEDELVCFIIRSGDIGFPRGRKEVIALVQRVCDSNGHNVSYSWLVGEILFSSSKHLFTSSRPTLSSKNEGNRRRSITRLL